MSRRRVSVKNLGALDCQGWLHRRKEGRSFLGSKWKRYWFVLQQNRLYWYSDKMDEKAEGFINLSGFTIEQARHCRKKNAVTVSRPEVMTLYVAAETFTDMNKWICKLAEAAELREETDAEDCYSEDSDQDSEHETRDVAQPPSESLPCNPEGGNPEPERLSWHEEPDGAVSLPLIQVDGEEVVQEKRPDEMESLYNDLRAASLSVTGCCSCRDFRASFVRRCQNDEVNNKLHLLRILSSTLKAKESELQTVEQVLAAPSLSVTTYREWRLSNYILLQEMGKRCQAEGGAAELTGEDD